jgi:hypothetical protein
MTQSTKVEANNNNINKGDVQQNLYQEWAGKKSTTAGEVLDGLQKLLVCLFHLVFSRSVYNLPYYDQKDR